MAAPFPVRVISPERVLFDGEAEMVACRTQVGEIAFLAGHVPLVGALDVCKLRVMPAEGGAERAFAVKGGFVEVRSNHVTVLSDVAIPVEEVDSDLVALHAVAEWSDEEEPGKALARDRKWNALLEELAGS